MLNDRKIYRTITFDVVIGMEGKRYGYVKARLCYR